MPIASKDLKAELLSDKEAAVYLKLSPKSGYITLQRWVRSGRLRGGRVGSRYVFRRTDLEDFAFSKK